jgi:hypothetical protein
MPTMPATMTFTPVPTGRFFPGPEERFDFNGSFRPEWSIGFCRVPLIRFHHRHFLLDSGTLVISQVNIRHAESNQRPMKRSKSEEISSGRKCVKEVAAHDKRNDCDFITSFQLDRRNPMTGLFLSVP